MDVVVKKITGQGCQSPADRAVVDVWFGLRVLLRVYDQRYYDCNQRDYEEIVDVVHELLLTQQRMHASVLLSWFKLQFQPRLCVEYSAMPSITAHAKAIKTKALPARVQIPTWA